MAYEILRAAIMQNIKTNNQEEITGAVMQQILLQMVSELGAWDVTLTGYATSQWVQEQLNGYVSQAAMSNYLPLTGGTMTGTITCGVLSSGYYMLNDDGLEFSIGNTANYSKSVIIGFEDDEPIIRFAARNGQLIGTEIKRTNVTSGAFIKRDGTSEQFLKADGSVDENTYATQNWVNSALGNYLPLTGGTMTGALNFNSSDYKIGINTATGVPTLQLESANHIYLSAGGWIELMADDISCWGDIHAPSFIKNGGTADQVLCADGSVKTLAQLKAALDAL